MTPLAWIDAHSPFPHPSKALPEGLLAVGGDLSIQRLTLAYSQGIFPWFNEGDPILWWSPNPRMVLPCNGLRISRSLGKKLRQAARGDGDPKAPIQIHLNTAFERVIQACAEPRSTQTGTWISPQIQAAYHAWHLAGRVHSVETWLNGELAGGLYGVSLGRFFFGESMFTRASDASKLALVYLVRFLQQQGVQHIDCQQQTAHLAGLGAQPMDRDDFLDLLAHAQRYPDLHWPSGRLSACGQLAPTRALTS